MVRRTFDRRDEQNLVGRTIEDRPATAEPAAHLRVQPTFASENTLAFPHGAPHLCATRSAV